MAAGDYLYQRITWYNRQKMSKQELKEEFKSTEGNPEVKAKLRQLRARGRPQADDAEGAAGHGGGDEPDPLRGRAAI